MRVLFVAAEAAPFAKVGGLGDVVGALPPALARLGLEIQVILPRYASIDPARHNLDRLPIRFEVIAADGPVVCGLWRGRLGDPPVPVYLIEEPRYLSRPEVYGAPDDLDRFTLFCRAALAACEALDLQPDVLHVHDWHTALLPAWLGLGLAGDRFRQTASLLTIHNLAFQGWFDEGFRARWELLPAQLLSPQPKGVVLDSTLALGLRYADLVTTVSPTYALEILTPELGCGLDPLLRQRADRLYGVLNGIDTALFDPATDPALAVHYDLATLDSKAEVKTALQRELGLYERTDLTLVGLVSRLTEQKGFDLVLPALEELLGELHFQVAILGNGEQRYHDGFQALARHHPHSVALSLSFDPELAQRIYAAADLFLMPSRFEPCGLGQLIAQRYGTIPVVRATGGLRDTVHDPQTAGPAANGFVFQHYTPGALQIALARALEAYRHPGSWRALQQVGMQADLSWNRSAARYAELYQRALTLHTGDR